MAWSTLTAASKSYSNLTSGTNESWAMLGSNTTARNTSRFVLLSAVTKSDGGINLQPAYRSTAANARGGGFYWTTNDAVRYHTSGESLI